MKCLTLTLTAILASWFSQAQSVELVGGSLSIAPGTTLINNGKIDLGESASVEEALGAPIQGIGTEVVRIPIDGSLDGSEPGGLGLALSSPSVPGPITITRGHTPRTFPEGDPSIARWFVLDAPNVTEGTVDLDLRYDPVELNGLTSSNLGLFRAADEVGPWSPLAGSNTSAANTVSASLAAPWSHLTAFDANAPTASSSLFATPDLHVWPTLTNGPLVVHALNGTQLNLLEVMDAAGRVVDQHGQGVSSSLVTVDLSTLSSGAYFLRVNGTTTIKLRKE
jgi:hypothetical protein